MSTFEQQVQQYEAIFALIKDSRSVQDTWRLDTRLDGDGFLQRLRLRDGLELVFTDYELTRPTAMNMQVEEPLVELMFYLGGNGSFELGGEQTAFTESHWQLLLIRPTAATMQVAGGKRMRVLGLRLTKPMFDLYAQEAPQAASSAGGARTFDHLLGSRLSRVLQAPISPRLQVVIHELLVEAGNKRLQRIFLESKALELLWLSLQELPAGERASSAPTILRDDDAAKLQLALRILHERLDNPPSLMELAKLVGTNDYKLKRGFKELYGTTVYGMLRELRLEHAKHCLESGKMNVCEAAYTVGYSNPGHFSESFRLRYGIAPSQLRKHALLSAQPH